MSKVKIAPQELDTDELLKKLEDIPAEAEKVAEDPAQFHDNTNDVYRFLATFDLKAGEESIKKGVLFSIYKAWSHNPMYKKDFLAYTDEIFPKNSKKTFYKINKYPVKLAYDAYQTYKRSGAKLTNKYWNKHVQSFLNFYSLTTKDYWIESNILFYLYDRFINQMGYTYQKDFLTQMVLEEYLTILIPKKITDRGIFFNVSKNIENFFQPGQLERMRITYAKETGQIEKEKTNKKRKSKKQTSKSRPRSKIQS